VHTPDVDEVRRLLDGVVEEYDAHRLLVRDEDPAALNARLVRAGIRVTRLAAEQRTLEDVVLAATSGSADRFGVAR
jgi:ABC-2 type transport system ATP-binding protein